MMTMAQLEARIESDLQRIGYSLKDKTISSQFWLSETLGTRAPGSYAYVAEDGIHYVGIGDRGAIEAHDVYADLAEFLYQWYSAIVRCIAYHYACQQRTPGQDIRRLLFARELELLKQLGENYYQRKKAEIDQILIDAPYNDASLS